MCGMSLPSPNLPLPLPLPLLVGLRAAASCAPSGKGSRPSSIARRADMYCGPECVACPQTCAHPQTPPLAA
eukprot:1366305-Amphidinium_carterae.1